MKRTGKLAPYIFAVLLLSLIALPFIWQVLTSLMSPGEIASGRSWPKTIYFKNYLEVFSGRYSFLRYIANSFIISGTTALLSIAIGCLAAYALARMRLRHKNIFLLAILSAAMLPQIAAISPLFLLLRRAGLLNTYWGLIIPYTGFNLPLAVWMLYNFFRQLPPEMEEAAALDGAGFMETIRYVLLPLAAPGVFTAAILVFIFCWNEFLLALTLNTRESMRTVTVGIAMFPGLHEVPWGAIFAAATVITLPLVILVLVLQKRIVSGLMAGAIKS
ncbi:MAG: sugar ABC transporter permease [Candidatus Edwardsbacteria bacterium RIFOXYD12_FULL_50_11]|uniref:Sugar ABC transporter permease n=1 Tax=Candidatus Edwardsbacteria bacterium GWF2_54_11 TaxID=1817851 RepID=A0A1F5RG26_9BACT|nr:MAG: sugar ABC transporter permease [Candidatus Edwardsbacteria bacterium RifOxyC12_full_54_24]OGF06601.1 MAG: sugar ABC transporter permease [Candidatus Edwardsbacteria bacterium RifOxyA12_full_54_48]OGF11696.1 MAG: sugar ABC transporter permease [Candidatus Edwardsbacteria bacterium GWE2_54_12]OGF13457.1 MAG: sugar ABC transporter permease [Candidatus Edwardsbacteria bacterium GWF2_54_11]OGF17918.1 MAG: sugar ABC transporter permease [Candidatus Edwardsbacteria bacterium RIFOXYD12_FULL_50_